MSDDDGVDYTFAVEEPPAEVSASDPRSGPITTNLLKAAETPGQWCRIATYTNPASASTSAYALRVGRVAKKRPAGEWEFRRDRLGDTEYVIFARFLG